MFLHVAWLGYTNQDATWEENTSISDDVQEMLHNYYVTGGGRGVVIGTGLSRHGGQCPISDIVNNREFGSQKESQEVWFVLTTSEGRRLWRYRTRWKTMFCSQLKLAGRTTRDACLVTPRLRTKNRAIYRKRVVTRAIVARSQAKMCSHSDSQCIFHRWPLREEMGKNRLFSSSVFLLLH